MNNKKLAALWLLFTTAFVAIVSLGINMPLLGIVVASASLGATITLAIWDSQ